MRSKTKSGGVQSPRETGECRCGALSRMADDPNDPVEFDAQLNEYHIPRRDGGGYSLIHFCPSCGGKAPTSKRNSLFQRLDEAERDRLLALTKDLRTVQQVIAAFGEPDRRPSVGDLVLSTQKEGGPETVQRYQMMTYTKLSSQADVLVTIYPHDKVGITFQSKPMLASQTQHLHLTPAPSQPQPEPQIDTTRRYDIYCAEPTVGIVVYRGARFKSSASLLTPNMRGGFSQYIELEQSNGQSVFVSRNSVIRFCEPGVELLAEPVVSKSKTPS